MQRNGPVQKGVFGEPVSQGALKGCELFFPLEGPGRHRGGNPRKMGKNYKIPLSGLTPENGGKLQKITKIVFSE